MSASKWPTGVDGFTDPSSSTPMNNLSQSHSAMHTLANDAVVALQQSVGVAGGIAGLGSATKRAPGGTNAPAISLDTAANWTAVNPVLGASEVAVETDTGNVKVGNGTAAYAALGSVLSGIYAPGAVGATVAGTGYTGSKGYDRRLNVYNLKPKHLQRTRAGLGRVKAGTGLWSVGFAGDSTTAGFGATGGTSDWPSQFVAMLNAQGYPSASELLCAYSGSSPDARVTVGTGWGYQPYSNMQTTNVATGTLKFTFTAASTRVRVWYFDTAAATFDISVDGGAANVVTVGTTQALKYWDSGALASANHNVTITWASGASIYILGVENMTSTTTGIRRCNAGVGGSVMLWQAQTNTFDMTKGLAGANGGFTADTIFLFSIVNDAGTSTPVATYKSQLTTAAQNCQVNGADVVLSTCVPGSGLTVAPYVEAVYQVADSLDLPVVDFDDRWGDSWAALNGQSLMYDSLHPNAAGYADLAAMFRQALAL